MNCAIAAILLATAWPQFGHDPGHSGLADSTAQALHAVLARVVMDPFASVERESQDGDLLVHYAAPILDGDDMFVELKGGTPSQPSWGVEALRWEGPSLVPRWTAMSDWRPEPFGNPNEGPVIEPVFQPVLANGWIYMPGGGGSVIRIDRDSGAMLARFGGSDAMTFAAGALTAEPNGNIDYDVIALAASGDPWTSDVRGAWLTRITPSGGIFRARYTDIVSGAPAATAQCLGIFSMGQLPWPPSADAIPPSIPCGSQRPGINAAPAIAPDGTIYTVSRAHFNSRWSYLVALNPDLTPKWAVSLRDRFDDGCNVLLPLNGSPGGCRAGARTGVDPSDNTAGAGRVTDDSSSSPMIAPDGSVIYGAYTRYNGSRGHMMHFSARGEFLGAYPFGWDITPAFRVHDGTYSVVTKENRYPIGTYCDDPQWCSPFEASFLVTQLSASMHAEWTFENPSGDEWCVNGPAIGADGTVFMNAEDGVLYAIRPDGSLDRSLILSTGGGQSYTPLAIDGRGRVYAETGGILYVTGTPARVRAVRP